MALSGISSETPIVGRIEIALTLHDDGVGQAYGLDGVEPAAAIGYLMVTIDRLREECAALWDSDEELEEDDE